LKGDRGRKGKKGKARQRGREREGIGGEREGRGTQRIGRSNRGGRAIKERRK